MSTTDVTPLDDCSNVRDKRRYVAPSSYDVARVVLGLVLLVAAFLKGHELATEPVIGEGVFSSRWLLIGLVELEVFFGLWLIAGLYPVWTRRSTILLFALFACVSLYKALSGEVSCGCFGKVAVSPWWTTLLDLGAVVALLRWCPKHEIHSPQHGLPKLRFTAILFSMLLIGVPTALAMASYRPATIAGDGIITGSGNIVVLQPEKWVGKKFPLFDYIDIGPQLKQGQWQVVLYRHDCQKCQEKVPFYRELATDLMKEHDGARLVMLELPPYGDRLDMQQGPCIWARLNEEKKWFVEIPQILILSDGNVKR